MNFTWIDVIIVVVMLISILSGLQRGFVREVLALAVWLIAFFVAFTFFQPLAHLLEAYIHSKSVRLGCSFLLLFVLTLLVGGIITDLISNTIKRSSLSGTDRLLGIVFGAGRGALLVALLLLLGSVFEFPPAKIYEEAKLPRYFQPLLTWLKDVVPGQTKQFSQKQNRS